MFNTEFNTDLIDLIKVYPTVFAYTPYVNDMEDDITREYARIAGNEPDFALFGDLLRSSRHSKDVGMRKTAWLAQQLFRARAVSVNQRILKVNKAGKRHSPLAGQLDAMGLLSNPAWVSQIASAQVEAMSRTGQVLDAMLVNPGSSTVYAVVGVTGTTIRKHSKQLELGARIESLFAPQDRAMANVIVPSEPLQRLAWASEFLALAAPDLNVIPVLVLLDDEEGSWTFQAHLAPSSPDDKRLLDDLVVVDDLEILKCTLGYVEDDDRKPDFGRMGIGVTEKCLWYLPVDRATRPLMYLDRLLAAQEASPTELRIVKGKQLHDEVHNHFGVYLDRDMRRHDIEDCLVNGGWVGESQYRRSDIYITASGIGLLQMIRQRFMPQNHLLGTTAVGQMQRQARYELAYRRMLQH